MNSIKQYLQNDDVIIDILCKYRVSIASQIHKKELFLNLSNNGFNSINIIQENLELFELLPPRKQWLHLTKEARYSNKGQLLSTYDKNLERLRITIRHQRKHFPVQSHIIKLNTFIAEVKKAFSDKRYKIDHPKTLAFKKSSDKNDIEYRPISKYTRLIDAVVIKIANKYLTILFDPLFCHDDSLAFRAKRSYCGCDNIFTTHHHAVDRISGFRKKYNSRKLYVSECDISKFYDSVDHAIVKRQFSYFMSLAKTANPKLLTRDISRVFNSYLESFSFARDVFYKSKKDDFWKEQGLKKGYVKWIDKELISEGYCTSRNIRYAKIGVPQGGALSGLIANMVLDYADGKIKQQTDDRMLYIRYCDDMLLLSTSKKKAKQTTKVYFQTLKELKLIPHPLTNIQCHTPSFWKVKSKDVYNWGTLKNSAPWIGFVGYEFRRTGEIRIRKKSLQKELCKQKEIYQKVQKFASKGTNSKGTVVESIAGRLIGMSVGRLSIWNYESFKNEICWISGFDRLYINQYASAQIKTLDRNRSKILYLAEKKIVSQKSPENIASMIEKDKRYIPKYYGLPFSYFYHYYKK